MVCPCNLFMVMAKLNRTRNCFLLNLKGREISSEGDSGGLGMKTLFRASCTPTISASIALFCNALNISLVSLHNQLLGSRLRRRITGQLIFSFSSCGGGHLELLSSKNQQVSDFEDRQQQCRSYGKHFPHLETSQSSLHLAYQHFHFLVNRMARELI